MNARTTAITLGLYLTGPHHPFTDGGTAFAPARVAHLLKSDRRDFNLDVDAVKQRTGDAVQITGDLSGRTDTFACRMIVIAARARIHRSDKHEIAGKLHAVTGTGDGNLTVFQRLAHHFEHIAVELRQFVGKEDTVVRQADFAGLRVLPASDERDGRNGVMGRTEGSAGNERRAATQFPGDGMNLGCLQALGQRQGWQDGRQPLGHHRLAAARRTYHDEIVPACCSHFEGTLHILLSLHIRKIKVEIRLLAIELFARIDHSGLKSRLTIEKADDLAQRLYAIDLQFVDHGSFTGILLGDNDAFETQLPCLDGDGQCPLDGAHTAVETKLPHEHEAGQTVFLHETH